MLPRLRVTCIAAALALGAAPSVALAQPASPLLVKAEAAALFERGLADFEAARFQQALPALERSYELDPALGTLLYLADCHARLGHTATAWAGFRTAGAAATRTNDRRAKAAIERAAELEKGLSYLTVRPAPGGPKDQEVRRDGQVLSAGSWGVPVPVDPGSHVVEIVAPGRNAVRRELTVGPAEKAVVDLPPLVDPPPAAPRPAVPAPNPAGSAPAPPPQTSSGSTARKIGFGAIGVGALVGGIGGYLAFTKATEANEATTRAAYDTAAGERRNGLILVGVGVAAVGAGIVTIVLNPSPQHTIRLEPTQGPLGARISGSF